MELPLSKMIYRNSDQFVMDIFVVYQVGLLPTNFIMVI